MIDKEQTNVYPQRLYYPLKPYKGKKYSCNWWENDKIIRYKIDNNIFFNREDVKRYIDKVLLREKKLERLKLI